MAPAAGGLTDMLPLSGQGIWVVWVLWIGTLCIGWHQGYMIWLTHI